MGFLGFMYRQKMVHPQPIPPQDLSGQTIIVTGSNVGIGLAAIHLLMDFKVSRVIMAVRTPSKCEEERKILLKAHPGGSIDIWPLDMDSFDSVVAFGKRAQELERLDIVLLNAGVKKHMWEQNPLTGHEATIQVNHYSTALLSLLLLPPLRATAARHGKPSRITITSSEVHMWTSFKERKAPRILDELDDEKNWGNPDRYNVSKLLNVLWTRELASRVKPSDIVVNTVNPGLVKSSLHRENKNSMEKKFTEYFGRTTEEGARTILDGAIIQGPQTHGGYLSECKPTPASDWVRSADGKNIQKKLWDETVEQLQSETGCDVKSYL